jgi:hypothetical protein
MVINMAKRSSPAGEGVRFATPSVEMEQRLAAHAGWVEERLGVCADELFWMEVNYPFRALALDALLGGGKLWVGDVHNWPEARARVRRVEFAEASPRFQLQPLDQRFVEGSRWSGELGDAIAAMHLEGLRHPVIVLSGHLVEAQQHGDFSLAYRQYLLVRRDESDSFLRMLFHWMTRGRKRIQVVGGKDFFLSPGGYGWEDVLLDESRQQLLRRDFEHFLSQREWFQTRRVTWRRGYLLHGPPGNGKTSVVRAMASHPDVAAFGINFANENLYDYQVAELFEAASHHGPGLVILEEIDRFFPSDKQERLSHCSLPHLLNCLDGVANTDGVVVVATANHPELLDAAILKRPGRFDRVIQFPDPSTKLRQEYFRRQCSHLGEESFASLAEASARMSFAQLREVWLLASQISMEREEEVQQRDLLAALAQVKREQRSGIKGTSNLGFRGPEEESDPQSAQL